ncbi:MAG: MATE family efflux transporter [Betaproteobacteria bacterium]|nr:MATE family efflux transporter [Betaproteobacteria bacterium]
MVAGAASPLLTAPIGRTIIRLAAPNMLAMVVTMATLMAEAWYVGQLGTEALAGLALGFPMMMLVMMLSAGSFGGTITGAVARLLGAGDREGAEVLALHAVLMMLLLACLCSAIFLGGGRVIYSLLGGRGPVLEQALAYSNMLFAGSLSLWLTNALAAIVRATGHMSVAAKCLLAGSCVQIVAAGGLVFGLGPLPSLGIAGAAAGILVGNAFAAVLLLNFLVNRCAELRLRFSGLPFKLALIVRLLQLGSLASINPISTTATVLVLTGFVAHLGVDVLAGYGIGARLELLLVPMIFGFGAAATALVGVHFGADAIERGHLAGWTAAAYSAVLCGLIGGAVALFPGLWANLFTQAETVRSACRTYLQIVGPFYAFYGVSLCLYFASQGAGRVLWPVIASLVRVSIIVLGCMALALEPGASAAQFFWVIAVGLAAQGLLTGAAIRLGAWRMGQST